MSRQFTFISAYMVVLSRSVLRGLLSLSSTLPRRLWVPLMFALIPSLIKLSGLRVSSRFLIGYVWSSSVRHVCFSVSANWLLTFLGSLSGKRNDDESAKEKLYTYVSHVPVTTFKVCGSSYSSVDLISISLRASKQQSLMQSKMYLLLVPWLLSFLACLMCTLCACVVFSLALQIMFQRRILSNGVSCGLRKNSVEGTDNFISLFGPGNLIWCCNFEEAMIVDVPEV